MNAAMSVFCRVEIGRRERVSMVKRERRGGRKGNGKGRTAVDEAQRRIMHFQPHSYTLSIPPFILHLILTSFTVYTPEVETYSFITTKSQESYSPFTTLYPRYVGS